MKMQTDSSGMKIKNMHLSVYMLQATESVVNIWRSNSLLNVEKIVINIYSPYFKMFLMNK